MSSWPKKFREPQGVPPILVPTCRGGALVRPYLTCGSLLTLPHRISLPSTSQLTPPPIGCPPTPGSCNEHHHCRSYLPLVFPLEPLDHQIKAPNPKTELPKMEDMPLLVSGIYRGPLETWLVLEICHRENHRDDHISLYS